jgi:type II secretory pathway component PulF
MPTFKYRAKSLKQAGGDGTVEGVVEAATSEEAVDKISEQGYLPVNVEEVRSQEKTQSALAAQSLVPSQETAPAPAPAQTQASPPVHLNLGKIKSKEITAFGRQLSSLLHSGVPILRAVSIIAEPSANPHFKELLNLVYEQVKNGAPLSTALAKYPKLFSSLYLALVSAGEASGNLDDTLSKITDYRQKQEAILSHIRSAMVYPILMALTGIGTIIFMLTFVMPRLMGIFANLGGNLPLPTRILIQISSALRSDWHWFVGAAFILLIVWKATRKLRSQNPVFSQLKLAIPVFGPLALKADIARFSRTMELLIRSGISILSAIETTAPVVGTAVLRSEFIRCLQDLKEGGSFGRSLKKNKLFPAFMTNLIIIGEESGKLDEALSEIAVFYERETDEAIRMMTSLMEPLMILARGVVVGFIVVSMLLPMFELNMMVK